MDHRLERLIRDAAKRYRRVLSDDQVEELSFEISDLADRIAAALRRPAAGDFATSEMTTIVDCVFDLLASRMRGIHGLRLIYLYDRDRRAVQVQIDLPSAIDSSNN